MEVATRLSTGLHHLPNTLHIHFTSPLVLTTLLQGQFYSSYFIDEGLKLRENTDEDLKLGENIRRENKLRENYLSGHPDGYCGIQILYLQASHPFSISQAFSSETNMIPVGWESKLSKQEVNSLR